MKHTMSDHAPLPPSSAERWLSCPGSPNMERGLPDNEGPAAREGTFAHDIAARALDEGRDAASFIGETDGEFTVDADMAEHIQVYLDEVETLMLTADVVRVEQRVVFDPDNWGTSDLITISGRTLHVADLKFGFKFVDVIENNQCLDYACAALRSLDVGLDLDVINEVVLHIIQPRAHKAGYGLHREVRMSRAQLDHWRDTVLLPGIEATRDPRAKLVAGSWCEYCKAKAKCAAFNEVALAAAAEAFPDVPDKPASPPKPNALTPARLKQVLDAAPLVRKWLDHVEEFAHMEAKAGRPVPGYKLVQTIGNRKWRDDDKTTAAALRAGGVDPIVERLISPNQATQQLGGKKAHKEFVDSLCVRPVTGDKLVSSDDPRPALDGGAGFTEVQ